MQRAPGSSAQRLVLGAVLATAALLLGLHAASLPLQDPDEARFARTSVEMLQRGDLVVPYFEGRPRLVKPPLLHWLQTALFSAFGVRGVTARLPAILATLGSLALAGLVARRRFGGEAAIWTVAVLSTMPLVVAVGRVGTIDALLAVHVLAVLALDLLGGDRPHRGLALGGLLGLAFLAKGPVGVVLPLLIVLAGRTAAGRPVLPGWGDALRTAVAAAAVVLPWGLVFLQRVGGGVAGGLIRAEALDRYFVGTSHVRPAWFYVPVVALGFVPWCAPLLVALVRVVREWRDPATRTARYLAAGLLAGLVFFALGRSKLPSYIVPLAPLAALLVTWELGRALQRPAARRHGMQALVVALVAFATVLAYAGGWRLDPPLSGVALGGAALNGLAAVVALFGLRRARPRLAFGAAAGGSALFLLLAVAVAVPEIARTRSSAPLIEAVPSLRTAKVVVVDMKVPSLTLYLGRVPEQVDLAHLSDRLAQDDGTLYVFDRRDLAQVPEAVRQRLVEVGRDGKYRVLRTVTDR